MRAGFFLEVHFEASHNLCCLCQQSFRLGSPEEGSVPTGVRSVNLGVACRVTSRGPWQPQKVAPHTAGCRDEPAPQGTPAPRNGAGRWGRSHQELSCDGAESSKARQQANKPSAVRYRRAHSTGWARGRGARGSAATTASSQRQTHSERPRRGLRRTPGQLPGLTRWV